MITVLRHSWALLLGLLLLMLGNGLQGTLLGVRGSLENMSSSTMGYIMSAYYIGFLGSSRLTPIMLKSVGHVRVFAAFGSLVSATFILYAAVVHPVAWWFFRLIVGFCVCGIYIVVESWLNHSATNNTRGQALSLYLIVQMGGVVMGQLLLNVADPGGYGLFVLITVLVSLSIAPMLLVKVTAPVHETARTMSLRELVTVSPLACFGSLMLGGVFALLFAMSPVYATERGLTVAQTSLFVTAIFLGGMLLQFPLGWLSDRMDRRRLIIIISGIGALTAIIGMLFGQDFTVLLGVAFVVGGMSNPLYSLLVAHANDFLDHDRMAAASGGLLFINGVGAMTGPIIVGYVMTTFGVEWFFILLIGLLAAIMAYALYRSTQRDAVPTEDRMPYVPLSTRSSYVATDYALDYYEEHRHGHEAEAGDASDRQAEQTTDAAGPDSNAGRDATPP